MLSMSSFARITNASKIASCWSGTSFTVGTVLWSGIITSFSDMASMSLATVAGHLNSDGSEEYHSALGNNPVSNTFESGATVAI